MKPIERCVVRPPERVIQLDTSDGYHPLGSCYRQKTPQDLAAFGYVEEEYIIQGYSNIYLWPKEESRPVIRWECAPYSSRILVRKPSTPEKFSGVVCMENFNNSIRIDVSRAGWALCQEEVLRSGDVWVGYDVQKVGFRTLNEYDPERYLPYHLAFDNPVPPEERGPLGWHILREMFKKKGVEMALEVPDDFEKGLMFDMTYQLAALLRSDDANSPLHGYKVQKVCGVAIADFNLMIAGFDPYLRLADGAPVFDGYLKLMDGSGGEISREGDMWWHDDPRSMVYPPVPCIKIETAGDMRTCLPHPSMACARRMQDMDLPDKKMCWYELAGVAVRDTEPGELEARACDEDYEKLGIKVPAPLQRGAYPNYATEYLVAGAYANLKKWMLEGITPPHMPTPLLLEGEYPNVEFILDEYGNHIGGVRSPYVDVPVASYSDEGQVTLLPEETLNKLYPTKAAYVEKVRACVTKMVEERWILPSGAERMIAQAEQFTW